MVFAFGQLKFGTYYLTYNLCSVNTIINKYRKFSNSAPGELLKYLALEG